MNTDAKHFLIMAGGTGGHVFPGLAVANELKKSGHAVSWLGTHAGIEAELVPKADIDIHYIDINGVRGKGVLGIIQAPFKICRAVMQSMTILNEIKPQCVLGMGGFVAGPGAIAAKLSGIPLVIHEQNAIPGTTNRILSRIADKVLAAFPGTFTKSVHADIVGNPVREGFVAYDKNIGSTRPLHLLVLGGSLGAKAINEVIPLLHKALDFPIELWHQTGKAHFTQVQEIYGDGRPAVRVMPFIDDMAEAYGWADIVICRSGAMTVSELAVAGLPAIFIPFPFAIDDHQTANARWMVNASAAILLPQSEMTLEKLKNIITDLNVDRVKLNEMKKQATALAIHDARYCVAQCCVELAR